jgi:hypothetical protein
LVISQFSKVGDSWKDFVDRNGFAPLKTVIDPPLHFDEPAGPFLSNPSLRYLHVELQGKPMSINKTPVVFHKSSRGTHQRRDFVPKKSLEDVLDNLKGKVLTIPSLGQDVVDLDEIKTKKHGRLKTQRVPDIDYENKRSSRIISRIVKYRHHNHEQPIPIIDVDDRIYVDDTSTEAPQYDFVSNLPSF